MKVYCDSSLKEGCVIFEGEEPIILTYLDKPTVNEGEYRAVIKALELCLDRKLETVELFSDSALVINQVKGLWKCNKPHLRLLRDKVIEALYSYWTLYWLPREENLAGKVLEGRV